MTRADELKAKLAALDVDIQTSGEHLERRKSQVTTWTDYLVQLEKRKLQLMAELQREDCLLVRPQPQRVDCDGWSI